MKKNAGLPLKGVRVLVGRARHQAGALSGELRKLGADVIEIPFIEIRKPRSFRPLDTALTNLDTYDWLILTSTNGVEAMWERMAKLTLDGTRAGEGSDFSRAAKRIEQNTVLYPGLRIAAIGPATRKALEQHGCTVDVVPKEYVAESVVRSLRRRVKGKRVLLVRAKVARDIIPRELRRAGAQLDVVEAYETVVPESSRRRLRAVLKNPSRRPRVIAFTSSSAVRNFVALCGGSRLATRMLRTAGGEGSPPHTRILMASIGPVTSTTLREIGLSVDISAPEFTIPGLIEAIVQAKAQLS